MVLRYQDLPKQCAGDLLPLASGRRSHGPCQDHGVCERERGARGGTDFLGCEATERLAAGGGTDFLGCEATERLAAVGYGFPLLEARLPDLTDLALRAGVDYPPPFAALAPGEGFLFRARDVLHRGILPTRGPRYVLSLVVLPSPETWKESLERWPLKRMQVPPHWDPKFMTAVGGLTVRYRSASAE